MKPGDKVINAWKPDVELIIDSINKNETGETIIMTDGSVHIREQLSLVETEEREKEELVIPKPNKEFNREFRDLKRDRLSLYSNTERAHKETHTNEGKVKTHMLNIPQKALRAVGECFTEPKYERYNWAKPMVNIDLVEAALRHLNDWACGIDLDESGHDHIDHAIANLMMLSDQRKNGTSIEGRNPAYLNQK